MSSGTVLALDIGGTHVSAGSVDVATAAVRDRVRLQLPRGADREGLLRPITSILAEVDGGAFDHVGVAVPGPFDYARGVSLLEHKLEPLYGIDLRDALRAALAPASPSIVFVNDADAFLLGEAWTGAAVGHARAVGVTLGTGLGSAFLDDARIVDTGPTVPPEGSLHLLRHRGRPVEELVSRAALIAAYGDPRLDVRELAELAGRGDARAARGFEELATALGEVLAPWVVSFGATCLVVGGSIARAWDLLAPSLRTELRGVAPLRMIAQGAHLDDAALLGAARAALMARTPTASSGP